MSSSQQTITTPPGNVDLPCPSCGYNLHGIQSDRCPECGRTFERSMLSAAYVPWARRGYIGRVRAYCKTVLAFTLRPGRIARHCGELSYADAVKFRAITVALASLAFIAPAVAWYFEWWPLPAGAPPGPPRDEPPLAFFDAPISFAVSMIFIPVFFTLATGAPGYFFHPKSLSVSRQNRGVALAQYTCAPLAFVLPGVALFAGGILMLQWLEDAPALWQVSRFVIMLGTVAFLGSFLIGWINTIRVLRAGVGAGPRRVALATVLLPALWATLAGGVFLLLHIVTSFLVLILVTLFGRPE